MQNYGKRKLTSCRKCGKPYSVDNRKIHKLCPTCLPMVGAMTFEQSLLYRNVEERQRARQMASLRR